MIADINKAEQALDAISYFRLADYWYHLEANHHTHQFLPDSHFDEVLACYYFDKDLKALLFKAIQTIEVAFRDNLTTELALGTIDCNPAHHWHDAVVPSPRHPVSWSLPSPYLCSRRTVPKMCFCSCFLLVFKFRLQNYYLFLVLSLCKI